MEGSACLRDYLFCLGVDVPGDSRGGARGSAISFGGNALPGCGNRALWLDARPGHTLSERARVGRGVVSFGPDFCFRLRTTLLGGASSAVGHRGGHDGDDLMGLAEIVFLRTQPLTLRLGVALLVGIGGVAILVGRPMCMGEAPIDTAGACALIVAAISWSVAAALCSKMPLPAAKAMSSGAQMLAGGVLLTLTAGLLGEFRGFHIQAVSSGAWLALAYLIVAGSIVGFTAYVWLIHHESPTKVGTYAYVNPVVAVLVGYFLGGEALGLRTIVGSLFVLVSVVLITTTRAKDATAAVQVGNAQDPVKA